LLCVQQGNWKSIVSALAQLKLQAFTKPAAVSAVQHRRNKLVRRLREQIALATAEAAGEQHNISRSRTIVDKETGERKSTSQLKRIKSWWSVADSGKLLVTVRYGTRLLEFAKGKAAIEVTSTEQLIPTLELLCSAVAAGELDTQIEAASLKLRDGFKK
jgi:hypothetical protein